MTTDEIMALAHRAIQRGYPLNTNPFLQELKAAIEAIQADAALYRWLQEHTATTGLASWMRDIQFLDDAVNAAMALDKPKSGA